MSFNFEDEYQDYYTKKRARKAQPRTNNNSLGSVDSFDMLTNANASWNDDHEGSLTSRRREFYLTRQVKNEWTQAMFRKALIKIRGILLWKSMVDDIRLYGTKSNSLCSYNSCKSNISCLLKSKSTSNESEKSMEIKIKNKVFHPSSKFKQIWNILLLFFLIYTFTVVPLEVAFMEETIGDRWFWINTTCDLFFLFDVLINLNTAIYDSRGKLKTSRLIIFKDYLKGMLIIDIISIFPFYLLSLGSASGANRFVRLLRMTKLTKLVRAKKLASIVKSLTGSEKLDNFLDNYQGARILGLFMIVAIMTHFVACIWIFSAKLDSYSPRTWIVRNGLIDYPNSRIYLASIYWAVTTLATVGFGDISPLTENEILITMFWMLFGISSFSFSMGTLASALSSLDEKGAIIKTKLRHIELFANDIKLPKNLTKQVTKKAKEYLREIALDDKERSNLITTIPKNLRYEIGKAMFDNAIEKVHFFKKKDEALIADIVPRLTRLEFQEREIIYKKNDYADNMYFIVQGRVCYVYGPKHFTFKTMVDGSYFGEIELLSQKPREFSVMTKKWCILLVMKKNIFEMMLEQYPKVAQEIKKIAAERYKKNIQARKDIIDLLDVVELRKENTLKQLAGTKKIKRRRTLSGDVTPMLGDTMNFSNFDVKKEIISITENVEALDSKLLKAVKLLENTPNIARKLPPLHPKVK
ncbi:unnamed protein product [Blepharisma stoltei]|uniref:Cyclic nucleotide-binding domain-containing protein n=1 Tax=Blepharisma stoltei TaxID=1481888 RepID=A0AAU9IMP8_9CILI|nr:unnamed protein product [Blepharisma stoltei]